VNHAGIVGGLSRDIEHDLPATSKMTCGAKALASGRDWWVRNRIFIGQEEDPHRARQPHQRPAGTIVHGPPTHTQSGDRRRQGGVQPEYRATPRPPPPGRPPGRRPTDILPLLETCAGIRPIRNVSTIMSRADLRIRARHRHCRAIAAPTPERMGLR